MRDEKRETPIFARSALLLFPRRKLRTIFPHRATADNSNQQQPYFIMSTIEDDDQIQRPYKYTAHIALPSNQYAQHLKDVVSVDKEISNKVVKSFEIVRAPANIVDDDGNAKRDDMIGGEGGDGENDMRVLRM